MNANLKFICDTTCEYYQHMIDNNIPDIVAMEFSRQLHQTLLNVQLSVNNSTSIDYDKLSTAFRDAMLKVAK